MAKRAMAAVQANFLDKLVTVISPEAGARRQRARTALALSGGYTGARYDRRELRDWYTQPASADETSLSDLPTLRARSRDLVRNSPIAGGAIANVVKNAVGTGLSAHPQPAADVLGWTDEQSETWADSVFREFETWAQSQECDISRTQNFYESQALVFRSAFESGDCFVLLPMVSRGGSTYKTRFQVVEADRIASPLGDGKQVRYGTPQQDGTLPFLSQPVIGGVERDDAGAPIAYYILRRHPSSLGFLIRTAEWDRYTAFGGRTGRRNVLHVYERERPDQTRGIPYIAPVIESLKQLSRFADSELMAAVVTSMFTVFIKSEAGDLPTGNGASPTQGKIDDMELGSGTINQLLPGEDVQFAEPKRPNGAFDPFFQAFLRQIGMRLQLPYEVLIMHFTASYSAARAALLEAWKFYNDRRNWISNRYCQPVYEAWMDEAVAMGRIVAPGYFNDPVLRAAYQRCEWVGDAPGQIDPVKEVTAAKARVDMGVSSLEREAMAFTGVDWKDIHRQRTREHAARVEAGLEAPVSNATVTETLAPADGADQQDQQDDGGDTEKPEDVKQ